MNTLVRDQENVSDARYAINAAKTELREGYNSADVDRILAVFSDTLTDLSDGWPTFFGPDGKVVLRSRLESLFREFEVELSPIVIDIRISAGIAVEYGWHVMTLRPKSGGPLEIKRTRYMETWTREPDFGWRIVLFIDNVDRKPGMIDNLIGTLPCSFTEFDKPSNA
jgi:ketosteroid isomerase-like protein